MQITALNTADALTAKQRKTLNEAEAILVGLLKHPEEVLMFSLHGKWDSMSATYFSPSGEQHSGLWTPKDPTLAGKMEKVLIIRAVEDGRADQIKAERVERLRKELSELTGEVA